MYGIYLQKYNEKVEQHESFLRHPRAAGYADVQLHLLVCGSTCGMFHLMSAVITAFHLKQLGVAHARIHDLLQKMHWITLERLEQITGTRRKLEHEGTHDMQGQRKGLKRKRGT